MAADPRKPDKAWPCPRLTRPRFQIGGLQPGAHGSSKAMCPHGVDANGSRSGVIDEALHHLGRRAAVLFQHPARADKHLPARAFGDIGRMPRALASAIIACASSAGNASPEPDMAVK